MNNTTQMNQKIAAFLKLTLKANGEFGMPLEQVDFSTDMNAAIQLAAFISARCSKRGYYFKLEILRQAQPPISEADFQRRSWAGIEGKGHSHCDADPAIAICTAVLKLIDRLAQ